MAYPKILDSSGDLLPEPAVAPPARRAGRKGRTAQRRRLPVTLALCFLSLVAIMAVFAPFIAGLGGWDPYQFDKSAVDPRMGGLPVGPWGGISSDHWFGVEPLNGRDLFARVVYGARTSVFIAVSATALTTVLGVGLGLLAGFFGGWTDAVISRLMDFLLAFPSLIFMIAILSALPGENRPIMLVVVLSVFSWPAMARVVRGQAMSLARREFIDAARASGAGRMATAFRELLPNLSGTIIVMATIQLPTFISTEAGLSFLGVGVRPPEPSWGQMISSALSWYQSDPMYFAVPGTFLFLTVLCCMVVGDHIQSRWSQGGRLG
ncbi:ABC transporter permease [Microbacterium sp. NPDC058342]|uniref:ABC transporter permease n=1 Tax=Microbacterium sp. NPDC058342 TaxID=3346454 RepID=UPI0036692357